MEDKRRRVRAEMVVEVPCVQEGGDRTHFRAVTQNISASGALLVSPVAPVVGARWDVEVRLEPGEPALATSARVIWARPHAARGVWYAGVRFLRMPPAARARVARAVVEAHKGLLSFLLEVNAFRDFTAADCEALSPYCFRHDLEKGEVFYREGETRDALFIIRRGTVRIYKKGVQEDEVIAVASSGEIFGEVALVMKRSHGANIQALVDTELVGISGAAYEFLREDNPTLAIKLMDVLLRFLSQRLERTTKRLFSPVRLDEKP